MPTRLRLIGVLLLVLLLTPAGAIAQSSAPREDGAFIDPTVLSEVGGGSQVNAWVVLRPKANLQRASKIEDWNERGQFVYDQLTKTAENTQKGLRKLLEKRGVAYESFWIVNAIQVTANEAQIAELARQPEVEQILPTQVYELPEPAPGIEQATIQNVEWGIDRINAPDVWSTYGVRGEGIVVASIDTGVQFNHPALVRQYRGNQGDGSFDHNYNWFDPTNVCPDPLVPCDNHSHGTHVTGTMIGDDGGTNQIGVAPAAQWIAAKGCESTSCSDSALLAAGQWMLAPTDLNGENPKPDLRPHIVNNSWGGGRGNPWYQGTVNAWIASGIFPMFASGNDGPSCRTSADPGNYVASYSAGAFDINNNIASFSSRGVSAFGGEIKPNIAAPGANVRSSVPGNGYASSSGTSMASPHVAGTVALIWSAAPNLIGDITETRNALDQTAIDVEDLQCGGTAENNNVWGEGRLDAFAAVEAAIGTPQVDAGGPYTGDEGNPIALAGSASHPSGDPLTTTWSHSDGAPCVFGDPTALITSVTCADDGDFIVTLTVSAGEDAPISDSATLTVANVAPTVATPQVEPFPSNEGESVVASATFSDPGSLDTHTCTVDYGEGDGPQPGTVTDSTCTGPEHTYLDDHPDGYLVTVEVCDNAGDCGQAGTPHTVLNLPPVIEQVIVSDADPGDPISVTVIATDPGILDELSYEFDCDGDGAYEVGPQAQNNAVCPSEETQLTLVIGVRVSDGDGGVAEETVTLNFDQVYCVNANTGHMSYRETDCLGYEQELVLAAGSPVTLCANPGTGQLRYLAAGCPPGWQGYVVPGAEPLATCVNVYSSGLRVTLTGSCAAHEWLHLIPAM